MGAWLRCGLAAILVRAIAGAAAAQSWPAKPIKIINGFVPGGSSDLLARFLADRLAKVLGQPVIVEPRSGANGLVAGQSVALAEPDGYTLLQVTMGMLSISPVMPGVPMSFDPDKDLAPILKTAGLYNVLIVDPKLPIKTVGDLLAQARANPGKLTYASAGNGSSGHLAGELLKSTAKIDVLHVPYKGGAPAITDLLGERISFMPINPVEVIAHVRSGRLRALAVASDKRFPLLPDVPTVAEAGLSGFEASVWWGLVAPAKTPPEIVRQLNAETNKVLANPTIANKLADLGVVVTPGTPDQFTAFIKSQAELWSGVIKSAGIQPD
jgi:tripartite-type tricarboxylate transporter receptor subunit TctC